MAPGYTASPTLFCTTASFVFTLRPPNGVAILTSLFVARLSWFFYAAARAVDDQHQRQTAQHKCTDSSSAHSPLLNYSLQSKLTSPRVQTAVPKKLRDAIRRPGSCYS